MPESPFVTCCWPRFHAALQLRSFLESQRHGTRRCPFPLQPLNQARAEHGAVLCLRGFLKCQSCSMPGSIFVLQHCWIGWSGCPLCSASAQEDFVAPELWYAKKPPDLQHILFPQPLWTCTVLQQPLPLLMYGLCWAFQGSPHRPAALLFSLHGTPLHFLLNDAQALVIGTAMTSCFVTALLSDGNSDPNCDHKNYRE